MLLKSEDASLKLEFVNDEFPEAGAGSDQFDRNWLLLRCGWSEVKIVTVFVSIHLI